MRAPAFASIAPSLVCVAAATLGLASACTSPGATVDPHQGVARNPTLAPEEPGTPGPRTIELHPIAVRDGGSQLAVAGGRAYLLIDGEPVPLEPGVVPARVPELGRGIGPREALFGPMFEVVDFAGHMEHGHGFLIIREDFERAGSDYDVYELGPEGWRARPDREHGSLTEMFHAIVTTSDDAVLGVRGWELSSDRLAYEYTDESEESEAFWRKVEADQGSAPRGFTLLAGTAAVTPTLPERWIVSDAISTDAGQIIALGRQFDSAASGSEPTRLLEWAPGQASPTIVPLPDLLDARNAVGPDYRLQPAGDRAIVIGLEGQGEDHEPARPYLAIGGGGSWSRVAVELGIEDEDPYIRAAALTDDDELWIVTGSWPQASTTPHSTLWRESGGAWSAVEIPRLDELSAVEDARERWVYDLLQDMWLSARGGNPEPLYPAATGVVWADGELWVSAELGPAFPGATELYTDDRRTALFGSRAVAEPVWLPSFDRVQLERVDQRITTDAPELGSKGCERFTIVLLDEPDTGAIEATASKLAVAGGAPQLERAAAHDLFLGAPLDAPTRTQLVLTANAGSPRDAKALVELVAKRSGVSARADCRPRALVRMVAPM